MSKKRDIGLVLGTCQRGGSGKYRLSVQEITTTYVSAQSHSHAWVTGAKVGNYAVIDLENNLWRIFTTQTEANTFLVGWNTKDQIMPLTYYHRTKEYLSDAELAIRSREIGAKDKIKREQKEKERWDELTSYF